MTVAWETIGPSRIAPTSTPPIDLTALCRAEANLDRLLATAAEHDEPVLVVINDPQRSTLTRLALDALTHLVARRNHPPRFRLLVATGTHRFSPDVRRSFEAITMDGCGLNVENVTWHDATDPSALATLGGVRFHRDIIEKRFLLPIGSVEPHYFAGVTGPHKTITIGCLSYDDIERNHRGALSPNAGIMRLDGNPVFDDLTHKLGLLNSADKCICSIGQVVKTDRLVAAAVGDPIDVVHTLLPAARQTFLHELAKPVDVLHLRVPAPLGSTLYQADKALKNNHDALRDGGSIMLEAECEQGIGPDAFLDLLRRADGYDDALNIVTREGYRLGDHKAVKIHHLTDPNHRAVNVALVSTHLSHDDLRGTPIRVFSETSTCVEWLEANTVGPFERGLVIDDAALVCAQHRPQL